MDPLRPFASLIRSLWTTRKSRPADGARSAESPESTRTALTGARPAAPAASITGQLRSRLNAQSEWNPVRARELFVECILLSELGEDLARDPGFAALVSQVSRHMGDEPAISARLDELLRDLSVQGQVT